MSFQMPQQETLVAGFLPDQVQFVLSRKLPDLQIPLWRNTNSVPIQKDCPENKCAALGFLFLDAPDGQLDKSKSVASAGPQQVIIKMQVQASRIRDLTQTSHIALLAFSLATQVDTGTLLNPYSVHPIRGTAPYTPPRYF